MITKILKIAKENPSGFTIDLELNFVSGGYAVANKETQDCFGEEGLKKVIEYAKKHNTYIGGWLEEGKFYFDASIVVQDKEEALRIGKENEQIAIYDFQTGLPIYL